MRYTQFFAILADQCGRFAPGADVPEEFEQALTELRSAAGLENIEPALLEAFSGLLEPRFSSMLKEAYDSVGAKLREHLVSLQAQRLAAESELRAAHAKAVAEEQQRQRAQSDAAAMLQEHQEKLQALQARIDALTGPK